MAKSCHREEWEKSVNSKDKMNTFVKEDQEKSSSCAPPLLIFMRVVSSILLQRLLVNIHQASKIDFKAKLCTPIQLLKDGRVINSAFLQDTKACHVVKQLWPSDWTQWLNTWWRTTRWLFKLWDGFTLYIEKNPQNNKTWSPPPWIRHTQIIVTRRK